MQKQLGSFCFKLAKIQTKWTKRRPISYISFTRKMRQNTSIGMNKQQGIPTKLTVSLVLFQSVHQLLRQCLFQHPRSNPRMYGINHRQGHLHSMPIIPSAIFKHLSTNNRLVQLHFYFGSFLFVKFKADKFSLKNKYYRKPALLHPNVLWAHRLVLVVEAKRNVIRLCKLHQLLLLLPQQGTIDGKCHPLHQFLQ